MRRPEILLFGLVATLSGCDFLFQSRTELTETTGNEPVPPVTSPLTTSQTVTPTLVGKHVCRECHEQNYQLHLHSGHASTFATTRDSNLAQVFAGKTADAGPAFGQFKYEMSSDGLQVSRLSDRNQTAFPLQYVLGSGRNAITLLTLLPDDEQGPAGLEHRVSWFRSHGQFGLTPGHVHQSPESANDFLGVTVHGTKMRECVHCHTTSGEIVDQQIQGLIPNVNCERCHGPGSEHVRLARQMETPPPYSVGVDKWDLESELQLCGSCHRLPRNVSINELRNYPSEMLRFQPIGLLRSACYLESDGQFMCTTCHNPHMDSATKSKDEYIQDCRNCHLPDTDEHVACPVSPTEGCIECHMPPSQFEQGMVFHDHWIRIHETD
ncbi:MAG: hypothetical protein KDB00_28240 [Planctomycetales bacterium]|nr:hypothetical protein [Planctomycetales bacterium]